MKKVPKTYSALFDLSLKKRPGELWKDIPGYEGLYKVSNQGRVKALKMVTSGKQQKWHPERIMQLSIIIHERKDGSLRLDNPYVTLCKSQRKRKVFITRLIFHLFVQPFDIGNPMVRVYVKDDNPLNIHHSNLELRDAIWSINKATKQG
ncbi:MAG: hypothetical protein KL787_07860 [Taibaiella sp.]|nr:hypothetical protein [Taibaiella sp.]MBX9449615.1 hypothetical protein [Taibaiella sp.]